MSPESIDQVILDHWKKEQCPSCRAGKKCNVDRKHAKAVRIDEHGKPHYYCFVGCMMLDLDESERKKFTESQFNEEGHYEQLEKDLYSAPLPQ